MSNTLADRLNAFLCLEADHSDAWRLKEWWGLWASTGELHYEVGPLGVDNAEATTVGDGMYLIADNRSRLEQRVIRMGKRSAHAEYPVRSRTRHFYANLRNVEENESGVSFRVNLLVTRTRTDAEGVALFPGVALCQVTTQAGEFKLREKRVFLDLNVLTNPGTLTFMI
ncbi:aromatic-ring-hydroxylating dioxygenase subunit beta [Paraburkholderia kururiensis]|uniref:aromatic-ring-hydroxylating dioxygenase subunit beta n=1 Tax=Paraburkholderia kururiensis TaxID=984307 RepID=UPI000346E771|nr:aromatic-ring-hydroxylating dioxygenase subunit beta [Paraburkholderia kururiensis]